MPVDMFIDIEGIKGECQDKAHLNHIDVLAWSWGASQNGTFHTGSGGGSGTAAVRDLSLTKYVDAASSGLHQRNLSGKTIPKCTLTVRKAGEVPLDYIVIVLKDCMVTSFDIGGSGGEDRLTENVTLHFAKFSFKYTQQTKDNSKGDTYEYSWDIPGKGHDE